MPKMSGVKRSLCPDSNNCAFYTELDETLCPICMEHPHNAVLLICSSHEKGCRSYICDTSYRHSNCLDQFKKVRNNLSSNSVLPSSSHAESFSSNSNSETSLNLETQISYPIRNINFTGASSLLSASMHGITGEQHMQGPFRPIETQESTREHDSESLPERNGVDAEHSLDSVSSLKCPLCRGAILRWEVVEEARKYLNLKKRSCSQESCTFSGHYQDLRRHARRVHPTSRPFDVDESRERAWRCLERQREFGDIVSAIRSAMPGAVVFGDYIIENGDGFGRDGENVIGEDDAPWWTSFFLFQMIGSVDGVAEPRAQSRALRRHRRPTGAAPEHRYLWGENLLGLVHNDDEDDEDDDDNDNDDDDDDGDDNDEDNDDFHTPSNVGEGVSPPRRRRRLTHPSSGDQS